MKSNSRDPNKSAGILQSSKCRCCISSSRPLFLVPCSVFFHFMPDTRFVLSASQPSPLWKKCVTRHSPYKSQGKFASYVSMALFQHAVQLQISLPLIDLFPEIVRSPVFWTPKVPQSRELKSRSGSCTYNLHHAVCFLRTSYQLMLKMAYCQPKWTHGVLSALVKCGHEPNKSFVPIQESNISTQNFVLLWLEFAFWFYLLLIYSLLDDP